MRPKRVGASVWRTLACAALVLCAARAASADETFKLTRVSPEYDLLVSVKECGGPGQDGDANTCRGPARVSLFRRGARRPFQVLRLPNVELYRDTLSHHPRLSDRARALYAEEYGFVFDDFNFDGRDDLAVCNGREGGYGGPSYTVFLFDPRPRRFVENRRLSKLTEGVYLGLFFADPKKRRLTARWKSGCCYHETEVFKLVNNRPVLVGEEIEDATGGGAGEGFAMVTTRRRVGRRWVERTRKVRREENERD
ncbi:MAG TPA: hypothetical protein VER32_06585 [Pyrinomonadaceae bacterium]|nr:hypothetical protein [Pyrinomonadaceae bacterium]